MLRRLVPLAAAAVAVSTLAIVPVPRADAAADSTCNGQTTHLTGTGKDETFTLTEKKTVINAHGGNDVINGFTPLTHPATVCMGSGDDVLQGTGGWDATPVRYLNGGKGYDRATVYVCFEQSRLPIFPKVKIVSIEELIVVNCQD